MASTRPQAHPEISWSGWGDPAEASELPESLRRMLHDALGVRKGRPSPATLAELELSPIRLPPDIREALAAIVGADHARDDHDARARHAAGKSTIDLLRLRDGRPLAAPDLVLEPGSHDEVIAVLELCSARRVAVVPFGGGTSVVGGLTPEVDDFEGLVALDVGRLDALIELDEESRLAVLGPGLRGPEAEALLGARGYTIGHFPQSYEYASLGGFAAARSSGQASAGYGRFDELVLGMTVATPAGTLTLGRAPKSAAGPDLRQLVLGSEGAFGVITSLTVQVRPAPQRRAYEGYSFPSFSQGTAAVRKLVQDGPTPTVLRLSDEVETALNLARPGQIGDERQSGGCLAIVGYEGREDDVSRRQAAIGAELARAGATRVDGAGEEWLQGRYRGPYLRDSLIEAGALVETLETVGFWSSLEPLYSGVSAALRDSLSEMGTPPVILCHISHVYRAGASLYFTVACAQLPDAIAQWRQAKAAAGEAILAAGGSITHHHGVGTDHRDLYQQEIGPLATATLEAVKRTLDPAGILNPGVLLRSPAVSR
ncbi:MAG: FAD-binding oxidoreductase [Solirubrobacteraceae bacterium]